MPYDERTAMRPSPLTSHARPRRGEKFSHCLFMPVLPGNPGSPGKVNPAGAFRNTVLFTLFRKLSMLKL
jgi:hypothetical protein